MQRIRLKIEGMSCASCAHTIESALNKTDGVLETSINITNDTGTVAFDEGKLTESDVLDVVKQSGYIAVVARQTDAGEDPDQRKMEQAKDRMIWSALITGPMMLLMVTHMFFVVIPGYTWMVAILAR